MLQVAINMTYCIQFQSLTYCSLIIVNSRESASFIHECLWALLYKFSLNSPPIQNRWKNRCCWLLHWANAVRQTAEPHVLECSVFEVQMAGEHVLIKLQENLLKEKDPLTYELYLQ